jgi:hypothetical protein
MKLRSWNAAAFSIWLAALTGVVMIHLSREDDHTTLNGRGRLRGPAATSPGVILCGPDVDGVMRMEAKQQIVHELLAGRTSLLAAAAAFHRLDEGAPFRWVRAPQIFVEAASEEEAYCRSVVAFLRRTEPTQCSKETADRLQAEFNALLSSGNLRAASALPSLD